MRYLSIILIVVLCLGVTRVSAVVPTLPEQAVSVAPATAKPGEPVTLSAVVYNNTKSTVTATVTFTSPQAVVATATDIVIPSDTAKVATAQWIMPDKATLITATISKATSSNKDLSTLNGIVGTVTVGGSGQVKGIFAKVVAFTESYRLRGLEYFTALLDQSVAKLGTLTINEVTAQFKSKPATTDTTQPEAEAMDGHTMDYVTYGYAYIGKAFFARTVVFYGVMGLMVLLLLRFIYSRFV